MDKMKSWLQKEPVLTVAALLSVLSMLFVIPSKEYLSYIDFKTLACLFCLMTSVKGLEREGVLERVSLVLSARLQNLRALTMFLVFLCYILAMFVTNDVALIAIVPITLSILAACGFEDRGALIVVLQTIAANIGSSLTPIGNPQNLYLFSYYKMQLQEFLLIMLPIVAAGGVLLLVACFLVPSVPLHQSKEDAGNPMGKGRVLCYSLLFLLSVAAVFDLLHDWLAVLIVLVVVWMIDYHTLLKVDYSLLVTFIAIFIFVGNLGRIGLVYAFLTWILEKNTLFAAIFTSQFTSNVPAAVLLSGFTDNAKALLAGVNIGGMGTLIASMASVISYKLYSSAYRERSATYLKLFTKWNLLFLVVLCLVGSFL